jgi:hypothetical protein
MIPESLLPLIDLAGTALAALLTFFVLGYLLSDVPGLGVVFKFFYRLSLYVLVGASVGYALVVAWWSILYPRVMVLIRAVPAGRWDQAVVPLIGTVLGLLLLTKSIRSWAWLGNLATGYLVGVGLGVSLGGALLGTLIAQSQATAALVGAGSLVEVPFLVLGTLTVLIAFTFTATARKGLSGAGSRFVAALAGLGRITLYVALGAAFAGVYAASVAVLVGRVQAILEALAKLGLGR